MQKNRDGGVAMGKWTRVKAEEVRPGKQVHQCQVVDSSKDETLS